MKNFALFLFTIIAMTMILGCSGGGNTPVSTPENLSPAVQDGSLNVGVSEFFPDGSPAGGEGVLGLYSVIVDTEHLTGEVIPSRHSALEDVLEVVDITNFLSVAPCGDCLIIQSVELDGDSNLVLNIGIKHPFYYGDAAKPITGKNRADLHVFNVEGIVVSDGTSSMMEFPITGNLVSNFRLKNASGYTPYLDQVLDPVFPTIATMHPYVLHFDDYGIGNFDPANPMGFENVTFPGPEGNLVMKMGSNYDYKDYVFEAPEDSQMEFIMAVGCTYAVSSASKSQRFTPEFRVPQHNKKAASEVEVEIFFNDLISTIETSEAILHVKVLDINHGVPVGSALNEMLADSSVAAIHMELPEVLLDTMEIANPVPISGYGNDPNDPLTYEITIQNEGFAEPGFYNGLIKVLDAYPAGSNTNILLNGMDGIERVSPVSNPLTGLFAIDEFATYQVFEIEVRPGVPDCFIITDPDPVIVAQGDYVTFDGSTSTGYTPIVSYEWDMNYDGVDFDVDEEGDVINVMSCEPGVRDVALRVTDELDLYSICTVEIEVILDEGPIDGWGPDILISMDSNGADTNSMGFRALDWYGDDLYTAWYDWGTSGYSTAQAWFARSPDRGMTWDPAVQVSNLTSTGGMGPFPVLAVDQNTGAIYMAWWQTNPSDQDIVLTRSFDRGDTWEPIVTAAGGAGTQFQPAIAVDDTVDPAKIYISYNDSSSGYNVSVASASSDDLMTWTSAQVDDPATSNGAYHNHLAVHPIDGSIMVVWGDAMDFGGTGNLYFDRSTDEGLTWNTDILIHTDPETAFGPHNAVIAINQTTGIPGVLWRGLTASAWSHYFKKALDTEGSTWGSEILLSTGSGWAVWAGSLDVSADGHWVAVSMNTFQAFFTQSLDDGETWSPAINVCDGNYVYNPYIRIDECKNVYIVWSDVRPPYPSEPSTMYFDWGT